MDENLTTAGEPTIVESTVTPIDTRTVTTNTDIADGSQVIESATPMDNNTTYNNLDPVQIDNQLEDQKGTMDVHIDPTKSYADNLYDAAVTATYDNESNERAGSAMQNFFLKDYDYDVDEVGSYWVGGAMNDVKNQMSFLNVLINEEMYDALDLQKYYFDNNLATARAYAAKKEKEVAYNYYRAAQEKAVSEGELTGWYMPAEGKYMLGQYTVAMNILENPDATPDEISKAEKVKGTVEDWFGANKIGTQGIKCLGMMNYEETVRHNKVMERLQHQANQAAAAGNYWNEKLQLLDLHELEIVWRMDLDNDKLIGHDNYERKVSGSDLVQYANTKQAWESIYKYAATRNEAWTDGTAETVAKLAGADVKKTTDAYNESLLNGLINKSEGKPIDFNSLSNFGGVTFEANAKIYNIKDTEGNDIKTINGSDLTGTIGYTIVNNEETGKPEIRVYAQTKDGSTVQITDENLKVKVNNTTKTLKEFLGDKTYAEFKTDSIVKDGQKIQIGEYNQISQEDFKKVNDIINNSDFYSMNDDQKNGLINAIAGGKYKISYGVMDRSGNNFGITLYTEDKDGNKEYYAIQQNGDIEKITGKDVVKTELKVSMKQNERQFLDGDTVRYNYEDGTTPSKYYTSGIGPFANWAEDLVEGGEILGTIDGMRVVPFTDTNGKTVLVGVVKGSLSGSDNTPIILSKEDINNIKWTNKNYKNFDDYKESISSYINGNSNTPYNSTTIKNTTPEIEEETTKETKEYTPQELLEGISKSRGGGSSRGSSVNSKGQEAKGSSYSGYNRHEVELLEQQSDNYNPSQVLEDVTNRYNNINKVQENEPKIKVTKEVKKNGK